MSTRTFSLSLAQYLTPARSFHRLYLLEASNVAVLTERLKTLTRSLEDIAGKPKAEHLMQVPTSVVMVLIIDHLDACRGV